MKTMTETELYRNFDDHLGSSLRGYGFTREEPGGYWRDSVEGRDRLLVDPVPRKPQFAVLLSFYPAYMGCITERLRETGEDLGFPVGPYLTPSGVSGRARAWSYKSPQHLPEVFDEVSRLIETVGLPWLAKLRDREFFANSVDRQALLDAAYANECAGNPNSAEEFYHAIMARYATIMEKLSSNSMSDFMKKEFIFVSLKLGVEHEKRTIFQRQVNYYPDIKPLR